MIRLKARRASSAEQRQARRHLAIVLLAGLCAVTVLQIAPPTTSSFYAPCPWRLITGTHCPGCGSLRGLSGLLGGDLLALPRNNLFATLALPFLCVAVASMASRAFFRYRPPMVLLTRRAILLLALAIVSFGVLRNLIDVLAPAPRDCHSRLTSQLREPWRVTARSEAGHGANRINIGPGSPTTSRRSRGKPRHLMSPTKRISP